MENCPACRKEFDMLKALNRVVNALPEIEPSADFEKSLFKRIEALENRQSVWQTILTFFRFSFRSQLAAAAIIIIITAGIFLNQASLEPGVEDLLIAENFELFDNLDMISQLDLLENWEEITELDENT